MAAMHVWPIDETLERMYAANTYRIGVDGEAIMGLSDGDKSNEAHQTKEATIKRLHDGMENTFVLLPR